MVEEHLYQNQEIKLKFYELKNDLQPLVLLHAQGVDAKSFANVWKRLSKRYHVFSVDCYGHGGSLHDAEKYNVADIGNAIIRFIQDVVREKVYLLGHSSGGLIAALSEEDLKRVTALIPDCRIVRFDCGHGIHVEKPKAFADCLLGLVPEVGQ